ncbi:hypothetical protein G6F56_008548 [Rhizopus delemar]|nr:hypothetical protein G6F56_008548 [Rhizopus delemar]
MTDDVDEVGWQYSLKFHGADWHGNYKHFRSFVRRRRWIRLRYRNKLPAHQKPPFLSQPSSSCVFVPQDIITQVKKCRLDREKMSVLSQAIDSGHQDQIVAKISEYLNMLDFEDTKYTLLTLLMQKVQFTQEVKTSIQSSLHFYSDMETLLDNLNIQS